MERDDEDMTANSNSSEQGEPAPNETALEWSAQPEPNTWMRGLYMLIFIILFGIAEMILCAFAVLQFLWMLLAGEKNAFLTQTGSTIGAWLRDVADFQTGASEEKPFPWAPLT